MRILVLGSGVIGVTTSWFLRQAGHDVTVVDRQPGPALETSHANGGQVSWSAAHPWAAPGVISSALRWMLQPHSPLVVRPRFDPAMWGWLLRFLRETTPQRYARNKQRMLRLARYSHTCLVQLRRDSGLLYDETARGTLLLLRNPADLAHAAREAAELAPHGIRTQVLDRAGCLAHEPGLAATAAHIHGGVLYPGDESGDCRLFTEDLAQRALQAGVVFAMNTTIQHLATAGDRIAHVTTDRGRLDADAYVLALGSYSPLLLRPLGIRLPVYPLKGYSLTLPIRNPTAAPLGTITDETYKTVVTRLGSRLRAAGTAELAGYDLALRPDRCATLAHVVNQLFPQAGDLAEAEYWCGLRPMTPDNPPVLGATPYRNLYLNTGHGTLGWTMACGSAKVLTDLISGRQPEIDLQGLTLARYA